MPVELDAAVLAAQPQRREVRDGGPEAGRPQDDVGLAQRPVGPADARRLDRGEHRQPPVVDTEPTGGLLLRSQHQPGDGDDAGGWEAAAYPLLDEGDGGGAGLLVEPVGAPDGFATGDPDQVALGLVDDHGQLAEELHG
ncbi:hypothetical protein GCM10009798_37650 [Nocardioides panacihumi]|uniref:DUF5709 domain-containing protein n=1 Tax=Nocardioides panacihumi TaxID=400774 RepID=A0ABN2RQN5_9ACTN